MVPLFQLKICVAVPEPGWRAVASEVPPPANVTVAVGEEVAPLL